MGELEKASTVAGPVDELFLGLVAVSAFFSGLIFLLIFVFAVRYRRRPGRTVGEPVRERWTLEAAWIIVPLGLTIAFFAAGASLYVDTLRPPSESLEIGVVGRRWMWKVQHPEGPSEINELHVPRGRPVTLTLTSEDVIHSFYIPAFRVKRDALPGRYQRIWFEATRTGSYRLFCAEYCGTAHSRMIGRVVVMEPSDYQRWLEGERGGEPLASPGAVLLERLGCRTCHPPGGGPKGPALEGLYGRRVKLRDGEATADEAYLRESIVEPSQRITAGYEPIMPSYRGQVSEEDLLRIVTHLKGLAP
jgi:cytochrome c oxidase subunit II